MKKAISLAVATAMTAGLLAGCGTAASSSSAAAADSTPAASSTEAVAAEGHEVNTTDPIELSISWWGGDSRHEAYQKALEAFQQKYPNITVTTNYGA